MKIFSDCCRADKLDIAVDSRREFTMSMSSLGVSKQLHATCSFACLAQQKCKKAGSKDSHKRLPWVAEPIISRWVASVSATKRETCGERFKHQDKDFSSRNYMHIRMARKLIKTQKLCT